MGMFDSVYADCPRCGKSVEFQTKAGDCCMASYTIETAPTALLYDVMNEPGWCAGCKSWFALVDPKYPPGEPPRPSPFPAAVREPTGDEYSGYSHDPDRFRWWLAPFTFADIASAMSAGTAETRSGSGLQPASAVAKPDAQKEAPNADE